MCVCVCVHVSSCVVFCRIWSHACSALKMKFILQSCSSFPQESCVVVLLGLKSMIDALLNRQGEGHSKQEVSKCKGTAA